MSDREDAQIRRIMGDVRTIAVVGLSARPDRASYVVADFLQQSGYRIIPVNPGVAGQRVLGELAYATLKDIGQPVDMVDVFRDSRHVAEITDDAIAIGAKVLWLQLDVRDDAAAARAEAAGLTVIQDRCPKIEFRRLRAKFG